MVIPDDDGKEYVENAEGSTFIVYVKKAGQFTDINEKEFGKITAGKQFINFARELL